MRHILYTSHEGGVSICTPSLTCFKWLSSGGYWAGHSRGWLEEQEERQIAAGHFPWAVRAFMRAMQEGGCTTAECYEIIRDRDCGHLGTAHELIDPADIPDRWFRDAWRRSHNGGPIYLDIPKARKIQFIRIKGFMTAENKKRLNDLDRFDDLIELDLHNIANMLRAETDPDRIRSIWPFEKYGKHLQLVA